MLYILLSLVPPPTVPSVPSIETLPLV